MGRGRGGCIKSCHAQDSEGLSSNVRRAKVKKPWAIKMMTHLSPRNQISAGRIRNLPLRCIPEVCPEINFFAGLKNREKYYTSGNHIIISLIAGNVYRPFMSCHILTR